MPIWIATVISKLLAYSSPKDSKSLRHLNRFTGLTQPKPGSWARTRG